MRSQKSQTRLSNWTDVALSAIVCIKYEMDSEQFVFKRHIFYLQRHNKEYVVTSPFCSDHYLLRELKVTQTELSLLHLRIQSILGEDRLWSKSEWKCPFKKHRIGLTLRKSETYCTGWEREGGMQGGREACNIRAWGFRKIIGWQVPYEVFPRGYCSTFGIFQKTV